jgi:hypothetical protein
MQRQTCDTRPGLRVEAADPGILDFDSSLFRLKLLAALASQSCEKAPSANE